MIEIVFGISTSTLSGIALLVLRHIVKKIDTSNRRQRLNSYRIEALVDASSKHFGNGEFRCTYENRLRERMSNDNFVYNHD